jgi:hypothetical protein
MNLIGFRVWKNRNKRKWARFETFVFLKSDIEREIKNSEYWSSYCISFGMIGYRVNHRSPLPGANPERGRRLNVVVFWGYVLIRGSLNFKNALKRELGRTSPSGTTIGATRRDTAHGTPGNQSTSRRLLPNGTNTFLGIGRTGSMTLVHSGRVPLTNSVSITKNEVEAG